MQVSHSPLVVFPACQCGVIDPTKPMKGWSAGRHLTTKAGLKELRFNDLRHQAITELCEARLFDMTIMVIAGHVSGEMLIHDPTDEGQAGSRTMLETVQPTPPTLSNKLSR